MSNVTPIRKPEPEAKPKRKRKPKQKPFNDYRDHLYRKGRLSREWIVQQTPKQPGDLIVTSTKIERQP